MLPVVATAVLLLITVGVFLLLHRSLLRVALGLGGSPHVGGRLIGRRQVVQGDEVVADEPDALLVELPRLAIEEPAPGGPGRTWTWPA